jgi:F0F1-type ATP synthase assembly protein I
MFRVVLFQFLTSLLVAAVAAATGGVAAAVSALLGGLACTVPNGLFALNLALLARRRGFHGEGVPAALGKSAAQTAAQHHAVALLLGEFFKVALTAGLLAVVFLGYRQAVWPALMAAIGAVLLVQPVAYALRRH